MKRINMHLGPLALLLTVIALCMSTLGVLSVSNAYADKRTLFTFVLNSSLSFNTLSMAPLLSQLSI